MAQSASVQSGNFGGDFSAMLDSLFGSFSTGPAALKPNGPATLDAQASNGQPASKFPPNGTPIAAQGEGASVEAITKFPSDAPVAVPSVFGIAPRPWIGIALLAGGLFLLAKALR
jgi:hypothetical protein